jgi:HlyD family secretion protein
VARVVGTLALGFVLGIAASLSYSYSTAPIRRPVVVTSRRQSFALRRAVVGQGTIQPRQGPVMIGSPLAGFQIEKVPVKVGQRLEAGESLVQLDAASAKHELEIAQAQKKDAQERQEAEISLAKQRLQSAQLAVQQAEESRELELSAQQKQVEVAELKVTQSEAELQQLSSLSGGSDPIVSAQKVKQQQLLRQLSLAERDAAQVAHKRLQQSLEFQGQRTRAELAAAKTALSQAEQGTSLELLDARIALAELKLKQTKVTAPFAATVLNVLAHPGELVSTQPLLEIADLDDLICLTEVDVSDVSLLHVGQKAEITSPAFYDAKLEGTIEQLGAGAGSPTLRQLDPRQPLDRTVTRVRLRIDAADAIAALGASENTALVLVGLRVDVELPLEPSDAE